MRRMKPRPRRDRDVGVSRPRRDRDIGVTVSRRDRDVRKTASRPSRDRDVRDRDYNPDTRRGIDVCTFFSTVGYNSDSLASCFM